MLLFQLKKPQFIGRNRPSVYFAKQNGLYLKNATHDTTRDIDKLITLDSVSFWDFDGSKPDSINNWYNVIAEDDVYTWSDQLVDAKRQRGRAWLLVDWDTPSGYIDFLRILL